MLVWFKLIETYNFISDAESLHGRMMGWPGRDIIVSGTATYSNVLVAGLKQGMLEGDLLMNMLCGIPMPRWRREMSSRRAGRMMVRWDLPGQVVLWELVRKEGCGIVWSFWMLDVEFWKRCGGCERG